MLTNSRPGWNRGCVQGRGISGAGGGRVSEPPNVHYVNTDVGAGGNGTRALPWNSMEAMRAAMVALYPAGFVAAQVAPVVEFVGAANDSTPVTNVWPTSNTTYYLTMKIPDALRKVPWDDAVYTYDRVANAAAALEITTNSMRIIGLQIRNGSVTNSSATAGLKYTGGGRWVLDSVKLRGNVASNSCALLALGSGIHVSVNCLTWSWPNGLVYGFPVVLPVGTQVFVFNPTIIGVGVGGENGFYQFAVGAGVKEVYWFNAVGMFNLQDIVNGGGGATFTGSNNFHDTGLAADGGFVNTVTGDFRLVAGSTQRKDAGIDVSAYATLAGYPFNWDAALSSRPKGTTWDRGHHEWP